MGEGRFKQIITGSALDLKYVSRGSAFGDYDNDGDWDALVVNLDDRATLMRNDGGNKNNWLYVRLVGSTDTSDGVGALIEMNSGAINQWRRVHGSGSYLSHSDLRAHFGLGQKQRVESIKITWRTGTVQTVQDIPANCLLVVYQDGAHEVNPLR